MRSVVRQNAFASQTAMFILSFSVIPECSLFTGYRHASYARVVSERAGLTQEWHYQPTRYPHPAKKGRCRGPRAQVVLHIIRKAGPRRGCIINVRLSGGRAMATKGGKPRVSTG